MSICGSHLGNHTYKLVWISMHEVSQRRMSLAAQLFELHYFYIHIAAEILKQALKQIKTDFSIRASHSKKDLFHLVEDFYPVKRHVKVFNLLLA
jgi:hypothetical protein